VEYRTLGSTGVKVSPFCLGAMMFGAWGNTDHDDSIRIIHRALDAGVNFVDTADVYARGESEEIVGKALKGRRDSIVLATKVHGAMADDDPNMQGNTRRWIVQEEEIVEAQWTAERHGLGRYLCEQPPYSILARGIEADILPVCRRYGMGVIVWSPLNGGFLTGRSPQHVSTRAARLPQRYDTSYPDVQRKLEFAERLEQVAADAGLSLVHLALGFVLAHPAVTSAIVGPRTMEHLESQLGAQELQLSADVLARIDEIVPPGTNVNPLDAGWRPPWLEPDALRA